MLPPPHFIKGTKFIAVWRVLGSHRTWLPETPTLGSSSLAHCRAFIRLFLSSAFFPPTVLIKSSWNGCLVHFHSTLSHCTPSVSLLASFISLWLVFCADLWERASPRFRLRGVLQLPLPPIWTTMLTGISNLLDIILHPISRIWNFVRGKKNAFYFLRLLLCLHFNFSFFFHSDWPSPQWQRGVFSCSKNGSQYFYRRRPILVNCVLVKPISFIWSFRTPGKWILVEAAVFSFWSSLNYLLTNNWLWPVHCKRT